MCNSLPPPKKITPLYNGVRELTSSLTRGSNNSTIQAGIYSGQLDDSGNTETFSIVVSSDGTAFMPYRYGDITGPITLNGNNFTITGTREGASGTFIITGTVSADGTTLSNIKFGSSSKPGTLTLQ